LRDRDVYAVEIIYQDAEAEDAGDDPAATRDGGCHGLRLWARVGHFVIGRRGRRGDCSRGGVFAGENGVRYSGANLRSGSRSAFEAKCGFYRRGQANGYIIV